MRKDVVSMTQTSLSDKQFVNKVCALFYQLPPQQDWLTYEMWNEEKRQMIARLRKMLDVPESK